MSSVSVPASRPVWNHNIHFYPWVVGQIPRGCDRALDVGCGDGLLLPELAARAGQVTGIDSSAEMVALARRYVQAPNVEVIAEDFLEAALPAGSFDFISAIAVIHWMQFDRFLSKAANLLRADGVLAVVGLARDSTPTDYAFSAVSAVASRLARSRRGWWDSPVPRIDPDETYAEIRGAAKALLPGVRLRRRLYLRYTMLWRKPPYAD
jgi:SAM-dependent methyltransferase